MVFVPSFTTFLDILKIKNNGVENWRKLLSYSRPDNNINPLNYLTRICRAREKYLITKIEFKAIFRRCMRRYWYMLLKDRSRFMSKAWNLFYDKYVEEEERKIAFERFGDDIIKEYIQKQKWELAQGCTKLVFKDGTQIPDELQNNIESYM